MATSTDVKRPTVRHSVTTTYMPRKRKPYKQKITSTDVRAEITMAFLLVMGGTLFGFGLARYVFTMSH